MYKRKEVIEQEDLDWDNKTRDSYEDRAVKVSRPPNEKRKKIFLNVETEIEKKNVKQSTVMTFFNEYEYLSLALMIFMIPYLVGLLFNAVLFYIYSGITLVKVFSIEKQNNIFELWSVGAYTFVTSWMIWIIFKTFKEGR